MLTSTTAIGADDAPASRTHALANPNLALGLILALALAIRVWNLATHNYVVFPDETFQYLEEAHRLAFGSAVVPWEYLDGIRSWIVPGLLAAIMGAVAAIDPRPETYVPFIRLCCAILSLVVPYVGFRMAYRHYGLTAAATTGLLCAVWYELVYYSPVVFTETLTTDCALYAFWLADGAAGQDGSRRRAWFIGALLGLCTSLRYQYAPAVLAMIVGRLGFRRALLLPVGVAALLAVGIASGLLDWVTWGRPFQSIWLNYVRNAVQGISGGMGAEPWYYPFAYFFVAWAAATPILLGLAIMGATAAPALAAAAAVTLVTHASTPHKEVRFLYLAIAIAPILIGLGLSQLTRRWATYARLLLPLGLLIAAVEAVSVRAHATPPDAWHRARSIIEAFYFARDVPVFCGLGVRSLWVFSSGGYTYLHRNVPIYFEKAEAVRDSFIIPLDFKVELQGAVVPQFSQQRFSQQADHYNLLIGRPADALPGFSPLACFGAGSADDPQTCVFQRPGGCAPPP